MKKFTFRLQTVLEMREKVLEDKRLLMAKVIKILNTQEEQLKELNLKQESLRSELNRIYEDENVDIDGIMMYKNFISKLFDNVRNQQVVIENTKKVLYIHQMEVNKALKEVKILEKLKEKEQNKFNEHFNYVQAKEIDDIATTRFKAKSV